MTAESAQPPAPADHDELGSKIQELRVIIEPEIKDDKDLREWCTDSCLSRFLRSRKLDVDKAAIKLKATLAWRASYKPHKITWQEIREEARTGKTFVMSNPDKQGRTVILMRPRQAPRPFQALTSAPSGTFRKVLLFCCSNENSKNTEGQIKFLIYTLELASRQADQRGVPKMTWLIDFEGYTIRNAPSPRVGIQTVKILQGHYPERLGLSVCFHPPRLFQITFKACSPFIDPETYSKIVFCPQGGDEKAVMSQHFDLDKIEESMGGTAPPQFNFEAYEQEQLAFAGGS